MIGRFTMIATCRFTILIHSSFTGGIWAWCICWIILRFGWFLLFIIGYWCIFSWSICCWFSFSFCSGRSLISFSRRSLFSFYCFSGRASSASAGEGFSASAASAGAGFSASSASARADSPAYLRQHFLPRTLLTQTALHLVQFLHSRIQVEVRFPHPV